MTREQTRGPGASAPAWLSIIGVGADGAAGLSQRARGCIAAAELVFGSARQLGLVSELLAGETRVWPSPFAEGVAQVLARRGRSTCVLASGDPFFFGVGATLAPQLVPGEFVCHPAPSSVSLAAARLGWPLQHTELVSVHGRDAHELLRHLAPGRRLLVLSWNRDTPAELARLLAARGYGGSRLHVLSELGGPEERVSQGTAHEWLQRAPEPAPADLNLVGLELVADAGTVRLSCRASLPDDAFEHDGQLTKRDVRAITLAALAPCPGQRLWDVGAGSGSVGIEWMRAHESCRALAIERDPERCARIARNARQLGVPGLELITAAAPEGLAGLPVPDAIFIGGGASDPGVLDACWQALPSGGRLVVNAVALETQTLLLERYARQGGELCRIAIEHAAPLGSMRALRPALAVLQWRVQR